MVDKYVNEEAFMTYLATRISPVELSTIYWCYGEIEVFFRKFHVLSNSLFETTDMDTVTRIQKSIERNKVFKIKYKKQYAKIMTAWEYYYTYIKEDLYPKNESGVAASVHTNTEIDVSLLEAAKAPYAEVAAENQDIALENKFYDTLKDKTVQNENPKTYDIEQYVMKADMDGVTFDDVKESLGLTMVATRQLISEAIHIVDIKGRLIHQDAFIDWEEGANRMEAIIEKLIQKNNGYISCSQLYEYVRFEMNMFLNDNDVNEERVVYDIARHLFEKIRYHGKHYRFYGNTHISRPEDAINSNFDIIKKYAAEQGGFLSFTALGEYLEGIGINPCNLRVQMRLQSEPVFFYYSDGILMFSEKMHIDEAWRASVKTSLEALFADVGDHIILRKIPAIWFGRLPPLPGGYLWTPLLLQSILRFYNEELGAHTILAMEGQAIETLHAMLVSNRSPIQGFGDVVISYLVEGNVAQRDFEAEELRSQLVGAEILKGNELIWNMPKALKSDERFAWDATGSYVKVKIG